jgi:2'-5' RNA ligase
VKPFTLPSWWTPGTSWLQVHALPDPHRDTGLARLAQQAGHAVADAPIAPVEPAWLHVTVQILTGRPAQHIDPAQRHQLVAALAARLATTAPFTLTVQHVRAGEHGIRAELGGAGFGLLVQRVRTALVEVAGPGAADYYTGRPHLALGYATGTADNAAIGEQLAQHCPTPAGLSMQVDAIHLLDVTHTGTSFEWTAAAPPISLPARTDTTPTTQHTAPSDRSG